MRLKYAEEPLKYLDSEVALVEILDQLHLLAATPSLYTNFLSLDGLTKVLELLTHENTDVGRSCTSLLLELIEDLPLENESGQRNPALAIVKKFFALNGQVYIVSNMTRLSEYEWSEDAECLATSLSLLDCLIELHGEEAYEKLSIDTGLLEFLLQKIERYNEYKESQKKPKETNDEEKKETPEATLNQAIFYCAEMLSILLLSTPAVKDYGQKKLSATGTAVETLLVAISSFRKVQIISSEEQVSPTLLYFSISPFLSLSLSFFSLYTLTYCFFFFFL